MSARPSMARLAAMMAARDVASEDPTDPTKAPSIGSVGSAPGAVQDSAPSLAQVNPAAVEATHPQSAALAFLADTPRPIGLSESAWEALQASAHMAAVSLGDALEAVCGRLPELFAVPDVWLRLDRRGQGWHLAEALVGGGRLIDAAQDVIRFANARGAAFTIRRTSAPPAG